jgi:hypothetical protein
MAVEGNLHGGLGIARGDVFSIRRTVNKIPSARTIVEAWLTVKAAIADVDGSATFQKIITSADVAGTGQIEDTGADGSAVLRFDLVAADTLAMTAGTSYFYDIQIRLDNSAILTLESGTTSAIGQITQDS